MAKSWTGFIQLTLQNNTLQDKLFDGMRISDRTHLCAVKISCCLLRLITCWKVNVGIQMTREKKCLRIIDRPESRTLDNFNKSSTQNQSSSTRAVDSSKSAGLLLKAPCFKIWCSILPEGPEGIEEWKRRRNVMSKFQRFFIDFECPAFGRDGHHQHRKPYLSLTFE